MSISKFIEGITSGYGFEINYNNNVKRKITPKIGIDDAFFLIYNWPDDPEGTNTSIIIKLHYYFELNETKYEIGTTTTFYDNDVTVYERMPDWFLNDAYPELIKKALAISKEKLEENLGVVLNEVAPFEGQENKAKRLANKAAKKRQVDYV